MRSSEGLFTPLVDVWEKLHSWKRNRLSASVTTTRPGIRRGITSMYPEWPHSPLCLMQCRSVHQISNCPSCLLPNISPGQVLWYLQTQSGKGSQPHPKGLNGEPKDHGPDQVKATSWRGLASHPNHHQCSVAITSSSFPVLTIVFLYMPVFHQNASSIGAGFLSLLLINHFPTHKIHLIGTSLVVQWLRLHTPNAGGGVSLMPQLRPSAAKLIN